MEHIAAHLKRPGFEKAHPSSSKASFICGVVSGMANRFDGEALDSPVRMPSTFSIWNFNELKRASETIGDEQEWGTLNKSILIVLDHFRPSVMTYKTSEWRHCIPVYEDPPAYGGDSAHDWAFPPDEQPEYIILPTDTNFAPANVTPP